jgi:hypothetical protein
MVVVLRIADQQATRCDVRGIARSQLPKKMDADDKSTKVTRRARTYRRRDNPTVGSRAICRPRCGADYGDDRLPEGDRFSVTIASSDGYGAVKMAVGCGWVPGCGWAWRQCRGKEQNASVGPG